MVVVRISHTDGDGDWERREKPFNLVADASRNSAQDGISHGKADGVRAAEPKKLDEFYNRFCSCYPENSFVLLTPSSRAVNPEDTLTLTGAASCCGELMLATS